MTRKNSFKLTFLWLILSVLFVPFTMKSQTGALYPVEINAMLTPPYTSQVLDYVGTSRFQCNVLLRDMSQKEYKFMVKMTVKDVASNRSLFVAFSNPRSITPGQPTYNAATDGTKDIWKEFFQVGNFSANNGFYKDGSFKEGAYNFIFQAVDAKDSRRIPISRECVFTARLESGGAPFLLFPSNKDTISCDRTVINFMWQLPLVTGEMYKYLFEISPVPEGYTSYSALDSKTVQGYFSTETFMPMYTMPITNAIFQKGMTYAWRVTLLDGKGEPRAHYSNKGASPVYTFGYCVEEEELEDYVPAIPKPKALKDDLDKVRIDTVKTENLTTKAYWYLDPENIRTKYDGYILEVRNKNHDTWSPYEITSVEDTSYTLSQLTYNVTYQARVQYFKTEDASRIYAPYSDTLEFVIPNPADTTDCTEIAPLSDCNNMKDTILKVGDMFSANGTWVKIDSISSYESDSTVISGFGHIPFPIFKTFSLKMKFDKIKVNCAAELASGKVASVYNEQTGAIIDLNRITGKADAGGTPSTTTETKVSKYDSKEDAEKNAAVGDYAQVGDAIYLKDKDGNMVLVGDVFSPADGEYTSQGLLDSDKAFIVFKNDGNDSEYIGFDGDEQNIYRQVASIRNKYSFFNKEGGVDNPYLVPFLANSPGRTITISAYANDFMKNSSDYSDVKFITKVLGSDYMALKAEGDIKNGFRVQFPGKAHDTNTEVWAIAKKDGKYVDVGKLIVENYDYRTQKVKIVPVAKIYSVGKSAIEKELNKIYGRLGITYEVEVDEKFDYDLSNFSVGSSGIFSTESEDMKNLQLAYHSEREFDKETAYLFLLERAAEDSQIEGDMPQGKPCGYIFMNGKQTLTDGRLVAHEIAHGLYKLDHTFEHAYNIGKGKGSTDNLLDYNNGNYLAHHQWELIKSPGLDWAILSRDEDNMATLNPMTCFLKVFGLELLSKTVSVAVEEMLEGLDEKEDPSKWFDNVAFGLSDGVSLYNRFMSDCLGLKDISSIMDFVLNSETQTISFLECFGAVPTKSYGESNTVPQCLCESGLEFIFETFVKEFVVNSIKKAISKKTGTKVQKEQKEKIAKKMQNLTVSFLNKRLNFNPSQNYKDKIDKVIEVAVNAAFATGPDVLSGTMSGMFEEFCEKVFDAPYKYESESLVLQESACGNSLHITLCCNENVVDKIAVELTVVEKVAGEANTTKYTTDVKSAFRDGKIPNMKDYTDNYLMGNKYVKNYINKKSIPNTNLSECYIQTYPVGNDVWTLYPDTYSIVTNYDRPKYLLNIEEGVHPGQEYLTDPVSSIIHFSVPLPQCTDPNKFYVVQGVAKSKDGSKIFIREKGKYTQDSMVGNKKTFIYCRKCMGLPPANNPTLPVPVTYTRNDDCSQSELFKSTATSEKVAIANANRNRVNNGECVYGLPKCSKWIKDSNDSRVYHITSPTRCGGAIGEEVENLFTVRLDQAGKPAKGSRVMNEEVAKNYLYRVFTYESCNGKSIPDSMLVSENGRVKMIAANQYFENYALRIFIKVTYDWTLFKTQVSYDLPTAIKGVAKRWDYGSPSNNNALNSRTVNLGNFYGNKKLEDILSQLLKEPFIEELNSKIKEKMAEEVANFDFCDKCASISKVYGIVARALSEIDYSFEGKECMYRDEAQCVEKVVFAYLLQNPLSVKETSLVDKEGRKETVEEYVSRENQVRIQDISNALSVSMAIISNGARPIIKGNDTHCIDGGALRYVRGSLEVKTMPNVAVMVNGSICK